MTVDIVAAFAELFVPHVSFDEVMEEVEDVLRLHGRVTEAPNAFVTGPSGIGKTTMIKLLSAKNPRLIDACSFETPAGRVTCDEIPLLVVVMPSQPTPNGLARVLLRQLGDPLWKRGDREELKVRLAIYAKACRVKGVVIDEAQRAVDRDGEVRTEDLAEFLKELHGILNISFLLFGMGRVRFLFDHDDQVDRRWNEELSIPPYAWGENDPETGAEPESRLCFIALLVAFAEASPLPFSAELDVENDDDCIRRFYYASRGVLGLLSKLLAACMSIADKFGEREITPDLLQRAFKKGFRKDKQHERLINPWGPEWDGRLPPALRDHTVPLRPKSKRTKKKNKKELRAELVDALTKS